MVWQAVVKGDPARKAMVAVGHEGVKVSRHIDRGGGADGGGGGGGGGSGWARGGDDGVKRTKHGKKMLSS